ncbi:MAG TPA: hypothetical protein PK643_00400 [Saprospiraceae bacterium]|nr:hypothetical protein [Saprospiraceae bacterium]
MKKIIIETLVFAAYMVVMTIFSVLPAGLLVWLISLKSMLLILVLFLFFSMIFALIMGYISRMILGTETVDKILFIKKL